MKNCLIILASLVLFFTVANAQQGLIARYPLDSNPNDTTGNYGPMTLTNAPFQDGGIYCNGIYEYSGNSNWCEAVTPWISKFNFRTFSIQAKFKVSEYYSSPKPVFVCGWSYRWLSFWLWSDSTVAMMYPEYATLRSNIRCSIDTWHEATITYDSISGVGKFYLDTTLAGAVQFHFTQADLGDTNISITYSGYSNTVFNGILSDLRIYSTAITPTAVRSAQEALPGVFELYQNYPNPFNPATTIRFGLKENSTVKLDIFNVLGQRIQEFDLGTMSIGTYSQTVDMSRSASGVYFYRIEAMMSNGEKYISMKKMILIK